jgi:hypothetical protein
MPDVNAATEKIISLLPDAFVEKGMDALDEPTENSAETSQEESGPEEQKPDSESEEESSSDADESSEGESDAEGEAEADEEDETDEEPSPVYTVKVDGKEVEVTADELVQGYQRHQDYTRKTMALADDRRKVEREREQIDLARKARDEYAARLGDLQQVLQRAAPAEPDWDTLRKENPTEFATQWAEHQRREQTARALEAEQERIREEQVNDLRAKEEEHLAEEKDKLYAALPAWADAKVASREQRAMVEFAERELGITKAEIGQFRDHRAFRMLHMAMKYAELQATGKKIVKDKARKAPVLRPGQPRPATGPKQKRIDRARERLRKTGSVADAAALFEQTLPDE